MRRWSTRCWRAGRIAWTPSSPATIQLVINTTGGGQSVADSFDIRRCALTHGVPHYTTMAGARAAVHAIAALEGPEPLMWRRSSPIFSRSF